MGGMCHHTPPRLPLESVSPPSRQGFGCQTMPHSPSHTTRNMPRTRDQRRTRSRERWPQRPELPRPHGPPIGFILVSFTLFTSKFTNILDSFTSKFTNILEQIACNLITVFVTFLHVVIRTCTCFFSGIPRIEELQDPNRSPGREEVGRRTLRDYGGFLLPFFCRDRFRLLTSRFS